MTTTEKTEDVAIHRGLNGVYFDRTRASFIDGKVGKLLDRQRGNLFRRHDHDQAIAQQVAALGHQFLVCQIIGGSLVGIDEFIGTVETVAPATAGLISHETASLPFPEEIDPAGVEALGDVAVTPLDVGIRTTVDLFSNLISTGRFVPEQHGLEPAAGTAVVPTGSAASTA